MLNLNQLPNLSDFKTNNLALQFSEGKIFDKKSKIYERPQELDHI